MKKILIIMYDYFPFPSANTICVERIINKMKKKGWNITVICVKPNLNIPKYEIIKDVEVHRIANVHDQFYRWVHKTKKSNSKPLMLLVAKILSKVLYLLNREKVEGYVSRWDEKKVIKKALELHEEKQFDKLLSISLPFVTNIIASKIKKQIPNIDWTIYELDPFTYNYVLDSNKLDDRKSIEINVLEKADKIISTDGIVKENEMNSFRNEYMDKNYSLPLPNLTDNSFEVSQKDKLNLGFKNDNINIVFTGYFYPNIRRPEPILNFFKFVNNKKIKLHIFGGGCDQTLLEYKKDLKDNLILHGSVSKEISDIAINCGDILLNAGNDLPNQTPSKVFEYMGAGKPIINFHYNDSDTSLYYLNKYPFSFNININSKLEHGLKEGFIGFCSKNKGEVLQYEDVMSSMGKYTADYVCESFVDILK